MISPLSSLSCVSRRVQMKGTARQTFFFFVQAFPLISKKQRTVPQSVDLPSAPVSLPQTVNVRFPR